MEKHQFSYNEEDISMMEYANIFLGNIIWMKSEKGFEESTFDLVVREQPKNWGYFIMYGLDRFITYIQNFKFSEEDIKLLKKMHLITDEQEEIYKNFKFEGDVWALEEGTPFFAKEPIVRITGPTWQVNLLTALALNAFSYPIRVITKASRVKTAANGKRVSPAVAIVRGQGFEQVIIGQKAAVIAGNFNPIQPNFYKLTKEADTGEYGFQPNINHATIKSYPTEREAMRHAIKEVLPHANTITIMVDTYDLKKGLKTLIEEMKNLTKEEQSKIYAPIDSGDTYQTAKYIRKELDKHKLQHVKITAYGNLEEYKITDLEKRKAPIDVYVCVTEVTNVTDAPALELVFKISEMKTPDGRVHYKAKLTKGKESLPGRKQIFRVFDKKGIMQKDIIGIETENFGQPMLKQFIKKGERIIPREGILETRKRFLEVFETLPKETKNIYSKQKYKAEYSPKIKEILKELTKEHIRKTK
jgi:nicotinate phosphoribosyltransferase